MNKSSLNNIKEYIFFIVIAVIVIVFAYYGFFPFNTRKYENIHYMVYDNLHLAFNIPNTPNGDYYCPLKIKQEQIYKTYEINRLQNEKNEINIALNEIKKEIKLSPVDAAINIPSFRIFLTKYDIDRFKQLQNNKNLLEENLRRKDTELSSHINSFYTGCKRINKL